MEPPLPPSYQADTGATERSRPVHHADPSELRVSPSWQQYISSKLTRDCRVQSAASNRVRLSFSRLRSKLIRFTGRSSATNASTRAALGCLTAPPLRSFTAAHRCSAAWQVCSTSVHRTPKVRSISSDMILKCHDPFACTKLSAMSFRRKQPIHS